MRRSARWMIQALLIAAALSACGKQEEQKTEAAAHKRPNGRVDQARVVAAADEPQNWFTTGRTYSEDRFSPLDQINAGNVKQLGFAWEYDLQTQRGSRSDACRRSTACCSPAARGARCMHWMHAPAASCGPSIRKVHGRMGAQRVLRRGQSRRRRLAGQSLCRHARRPADRARCRHRQSVVEPGHAHRSLALLHDHRRATDRWRQSRHRQRRRRNRRARLHHCVRRRKRRDGVALLHRAWRSEAAVRASRARGGGEDLGPQQPLGSRRRWHRLGCHGLRPAAEPAVRRHRQCESIPAIGAQPQGRRQSSISARFSPSIPTPADGMALPDHARRDVGLHSRAAHDPRRSADRRQHAQGADAGAEERLLLCARSRHRRTAVGGEICRRELGESRRSRKPADRC